MYQGTTPAIIYTIKGVDLSAMVPYVSFQSANGNVLTKTSADGVTVEFDEEDEITMVICCLTQRETLDMMKGNVKTQIRFIDSNNEAFATEKKTVRVDDVIYKEIIAFGGN